MASNTSFLSTADLDFSAIKASLKTYLQGQSQFADYDFEGSNLNVLLDLLSYNTYLNSFYLNMVGSEMFLDTAQLRESAISHAKELNYVPRSKTSAVAYVNVTINTGTETPSYVIIPSNYAFNTTVGTQRFTFLVPEDVVVLPSATAGVYTAANVAIYEGEPVTEYFSVSNTSTYILQSHNIDTRSIKVTVYESNTSTTPYPYTEATSLFGLTSSSNVYFVQGYASEQYQLVFGNGVTGKELAHGNLVKVEYRDTLGEDGNGAYVFTRSSAIDGYDSVSAITVAAATEGSDRESIESIKFNAPRYFQTQERCVTTYDYVTLTKAKFPQLQSVNAFGGEELDPPQFGRVAISVKPYGTTAIISNFLKNNIIAYLQEKNLTTEPIIVDPEFFYVRIITNTVYNSTLTSASLSQIRSLVEQAILNYGNTNLTEFGSDLRYSRLVQAIDGADPSIISNSTELLIAKRWSPVVNNLTSLTFNFDNPLYHEDVLYELPTGHELALYSDIFTYTDQTGIEYNGYIGDDGLGRLHVYSDLVVNGVATRTKVNSNIGTVDYYTGAVTFATTVSQYTGTHINVYGRLKDKDVFAVKNKFLLIDSADLSVTTTAVNE
jgi:hypothetical protein